MANYPKYDKDYYGWIMANAQLMREGKMSEVDIENLIEEMESMGGNQYNQLVNRLCVLIAHLLKWQYQPALQGRSWTLTIKEQRRKVKRIIAHNPSLKGRIDEAFREAYEDALFQAERETGLLESAFPTECPYSFEHCLDEEFYPQ